jgi:hypothetical protein
MVAAVVVLVEVGRTTSMVLLVAALVKHQH